MKVRPDSDYDVAAHLETLDCFGAETERIASIETKILYASGAVINALPSGLEPAPNALGFPVLEMNSASSTPTTRAEADK